MVAVSGGEDSHSLLHALLSCRELLCRKERTRLELSIAHFNHGLRPESAAESQFVEELAERYRLPCSIECAGARPPAGENVESWARRVRYSFLESVRQSAGAHLVVTAHHRNDCAETVLFRVLSGRLPQGWLGIPEIDLRRSLLRPLLAVSKEQVVDYAAAHRLEFVLDSSNSDQKRTRNRLRHELIPHLERNYNPRLIDSLCLYAERYERDERYFSRAAAQELGRLGPVVNCAALNALPEPIRLRVIGLLAEEQIREAGQQLGLRDLRAVAEWVSEAKPEYRVLQIGRGIECLVSRDRGVLFRECLEARRPSDRGAPQCLAIPGFVERVYPDGREVTIRAGIVVVKDEVRSHPDRMLEWLRRREARPQSLAHAVEYFDLEQLPSPQLVIRERQLGDRVRVFRRGERKLKKLFLERGVDPERRDAVPVVESDTKIIWVPGVARSEFAPVSQQSKFLLELRYNCSDLPAQTG